jgi:hypothetical protein
MENYNSKYETFEALKREHRALHMLKAPDWYIAKIYKQGEKHARAARK